MSDLSAKEQEHVRRALLFLKARFQTWKSVAGMLGMYRDNAVKLARFAKGGPVSLTLAFRVARVIGVGMDDVLAGRHVPEGLCPHCGGELAPQD